MSINSDKTSLWKADIAASVAQFNAWFLTAAPKAYRSERREALESVRQAFVHTDDHRVLTPAIIRAHPEIVPVLRMSTSPPLAVDRLIGLADVAPNLVKSMEKHRRLPPKMSFIDIDRGLGKICTIVAQLLDADLFPWVTTKTGPSEEDRTLSITVVADRRCSAIADPIVRNAQEARQLELIDRYLRERGYLRKPHPGTSPISEMTPGTYTFRLNLSVGAARKVNIPIDVVIQPKKPRQGGIPILIEAKSAGDFTNTNKRRKEEAQKIHQLREKYGADVRLVLFLCGYFDAGYLGYEASEGIDWIWEHRIDDLDQLGI